MRSPSDKAPRDTQTWRRNGGAPTPGAGTPWPLISHGWPSVCNLPGFGRLHVWCSPLDFWKMCADLPFNLCDWLHACMNANVVFRVGVVCDKRYDVELCWVLNLQIASVSTAKWTKIWPIWFRITLLITDVTTELCSSLAFNCCHSQRDLWALVKRFIRHTAVFSGTPFMGKSLPYNTTCTFQAKTRRKI
jgi:hypothetical protein